MDDVLIAGGGVAGCSLAILLGRQGYRVTVFDKARFPRDKVCGEGLMPAGVDALRETAVPVEGRPFQGVRYHMGGLTAEARFRSGFGLGVQRLRFDESMLEQAAAVARVHQGARVQSAWMDNGRVAGLIVNGKVHRARLTIAADGVHSPVRSSLGVPVKRGAARFALRAHFRADWDPSVDVYWGREEEIYVTPLPGGVVSVALLAAARSQHGSSSALLRQAIARFPELEERLRGAAQLDEARGASSWNLTPGVRFLPGLLLHGDAAGYVDPLTGGGMTQALLVSRLIARHLAAGIPDSLDALDRERQRLLRDYRRLTKAALWLAMRPGLSKASFQVLRCCPGVFSQLLSVAGNAR